MPSGVLRAGYQADDRQLAVGLVSVFGVAGRGGGDLLPGLVAVGSVELFGDHGGFLAGDATLTGDGGAALPPIEGGEHVARFLADIGAIRGNVELLERTVNGPPGLVAQQDGVTVVVYAFEIADGRITRIWAMLNPGKLRPWAAS
jgi:hypothetical protein